MDVDAERDPDIAIIGLSGRFPGARNVEEFWENLRSGAESISFFDDAELLAAGIDPEVLSDPRYVKAAPVLPDVERFDARLFGYSPREASCIDPQQRIFLECAWEALEVAGYDPAKFGRPIGVYAGASISTYLLLGDLLPQLREDYLFTVLANDKDFLPTRVSYKLDLTGPSIAVQTACSTALVAVHCACQSLLDLECDLALAGGVSVRVPQKAGYLHREGGILSPDGHCRAFDAAAQGTIFGSGAGVVVLKRLTDALADGDCVHAVIKGSAVNNDGAAKADFAAPSVAGQARAVVEAISRSGVDADTLSYVEAHGTGTRLGDPIEIAALSTAFRAFTQRKGFCAIGSAKTNIGHTDAAAGAIGLIKTVLALEHQLIPPTLHYQQPNPELNLGSSPFYVNSELADWKSDGGPRRAGVNSLGMGGTNAFVVVEEPPARPARGVTWPDQLLRVSARTQSALDAATARLAGHLARHPGTDLADVAYTLQLGRRDLPYRRVMVCRDTAEAMHLLANPLDPAVRTARADRPARDVIFLFPGQGTQYVNMGSGLYRTESVFREQLDRCCEILRPVLGRDLREILYPDPGSSPRAASELDRTEFTQPALFAVEYALAQLWISWGVRPAACIGHSLGEIVSACLSGVFSLEDALSLVALRGRLLQQLPPGSMLVLPLSPDDVQPYLGAEVSLAAVNGPAQVVVAGSAAVMSQLAARLAGGGVPAQPLKSARAFHSAAVDPALDALTRHVEGLALSAPRVRYISNVTGTWITDEQSVDPRYWARQMRQTVRFADGMRELADTTDGVFLEVGPGHTLGNLARRYAARPAGQGVLASMPDSAGSGSDRAFLLRAAGRLWLAGRGVDGREFFAGQRPRRVPLPTYPFERERYWVDQAGPGRAAGGRAPAARAPDAPAADGDRAAARPEGLPDDAYARPRTPVEGAIATVWCSVLGIDQIGAHDDFFQLGGTSVLIPQVLSRVNEMFQADLAVLTLLESPTVAELARCVEAVYELAEGLPPPAPKNNS
jgi:phthiocerol/phenolphthiocerol synthesis type-I polyketide synthase E